MLPEGGGRGEDEASQPPSSVRAPVAAGTRRGARDADWEKKGRWRPGRRSSAAGRGRRRSCGDWRERSRGDWLVEARVSLLLQPLADMSRRGGGDGGARAEQDVGCGGAGA